MRKISKRLQKAMGLSNIVSLAASPIVARKRVSDSPFVTKKVMKYNYNFYSLVDYFRQINIVWECSENHTLIYRYLK